MTRAMRRTIPKSLPFLCVLIAAMTATKLTAMAQQAAARPDRGAKPTGTYALSDIESIDVVNGNLSLSIPLASLPPIAGGRLSYGLTAVYNSKLFDVGRDEQIHNEPPIYNLVRDNVQLKDFPGWRIQGGYGFVLRDSRLDFDWEFPNCDFASGGGSDPDCGWFKNGTPPVYYNDWHKWYFITPDGAEHEMKPVGYGPFTGSRGYLWGYYKEIPDTVGGPMTFYSFDGSYIWVKANQSTSGVLWEAYLPDGTRIMQRNNGGIKQIKDPNGNKIEIDTTFDGSGNPTSHIRDTLTGREIKGEFIPGTGNSFTDRISYQTVGGGWANIDVVYEQTTVFGKTYETTLPPELMGGTCFEPTDLVPATIDVIRKIVLPTTETGVERKFQFTYTTDSEPVPVNLQYWTFCDQAPQPIYEASNGWGSLSRMVTPSGAIVDYTYDFTSVHNLATPNDIARQRVQTKTVTHDGTTDTWDYTNGVTGPDGSHTLHYSYPQDGGWPGNFGGSDGLGGLVYKIDYSGKKIVERRWIRKMFDTANDIVSVGQHATFNAVVKEEYTTLVGNPSKMTATTFEYDFNGNVTKETQYDWFDPSLVTREQNTANLPQGVPTSATALRVIDHSYYNDSTSGSSPNVYAKRVIGDPPTPLILNAPLESAVLDGSLSTLSRTQFLYDNHSSTTTPPNPGNLTEEKHRLLQESRWISTTHAYDSFGNRTLTIQPNSNNHPNGNRTEVAYDPVTNAQPISVTIYPDPADTTNKFVTTTEYDFSTGLVKKQTDPNGNVTDFDFRNNRLTTNPSSPVIDPFGRPGVVKSPAVTSTFDGTPHPNQQRTILTSYFDSTSKVEVISDLKQNADGLLKSQTSHDQLGRVVKTESSENGSTYAISSETVYKYKPGGQDGMAVFTTNPHRSTGAMTDGWTRTTQDVLGRTVEAATFSSSPPDTGCTGSACTGKVVTDYNAQQTTVTDQAGKKRRSFTDGLGRLKQVDELNEDGTLYASTVYLYDALGNLLQVDQGTQHRYFTYDSLSRLKTAKNPEQVNASGQMVETNYAYDDASNLLSRTGPNTGSSVIYTYDGLNRVKTKTLSPGGTFTYAYDTGTNGKGKLVSVTQSGGDGFFYDGYDGLGRVTASRQVTTAGVSNTYTMSYGYDLAGNLTTQTYPSGKEYRTSYDNAGRVSDVKRFVGGTFDKTYASQFGYSAHGAVTSVTLGNNLVETTAFNSRLQPSSITLGSLASFTYTFGVLVGGTLDTIKNNGNIQSQTVTIAANSIKQSYSYDALNRLSQVEESLNASSRWTQSYGYDRWGNRTSLSNSGTDGGLLPTQSTPAVDATTNRLFGLGYDIAGNLTTNALGQQLQYDAENRMTNFASGTGQYFYDGDGRRVKKIDNNGTTVFVYNAGGQLIAEYHSDPVPPATGEGGTSYLTTDHLGSTRVVTSAADGSGNVTVKARYDYLPFGEELGSGIGGRTTGMGYGGNDATRQKFTQKERDSESGLDYFLARYYSSAQGRFTSVDPLLFHKEMLVEPQRYNRFAYVANNPLRYTDPDGNEIRLRGNDEERKIALGLLRKAVGDTEGKYLYEYSRTDKHGKLRYFVGVHQKGVDGKSADFSSLNEVSATVSRIISDKRVVQIMFRREGSVVTGYGGDKERIGAVDLNKHTTPGTSTSNDSAGKVWLLDADSDYGVLPFQLFDSGPGDRPDPAVVMAHELGHVAYSWHLLFGPSEDAAVIMENNARKVLDPGARLRVRHNPSGPKVGERGASFHLPWPPKE